jgi:hypothetical protein
MPDIGWRTRFESMVDKLRQDPRITVKQAAFNPPAAADDLALASKLANGRLPDGCQPFYEAMDGFTLEWEAKQRVTESGNDRGSIRLLPIAQVFGSWQGATWFPEPRSDVRYQSIKPFDLFTTEACAAFNVKPQQPAKPSVYFHYFGEATVNTGYSFEEYLERLLMSRGYWYWMQALSHETSDNPEAIAFRAAAPQLFDDYDDSQFTPR